MFEPKEWKIDRFNEKLKTCFRLQTLARLKSHLKLHDDDKPFICDVCGKRYHDQNAVKLHMVGHLEVLPFPCTYCDKRFRHKGLLNVS